MTTANSHRDLSRNGSHTDKQATRAPFVSRAPGQIWRTTATFLSTVANLGTAGYPPDTRRRLKIVNVISALIAVTTLIYAAQLATSEMQEMRPIVYLNVALAIIVMCVPLMHRFNDLAGSLLLIAAEFAALVGFAEYFGRTGGNTLQYVVAAAAPFVIFERRHLWLVVAIVLTALSLHLYTWFTYPRSAALLQVDDAMLASLYVQGAITTFGLIAASVYYAFSLAERAKAETDTLLRNVLPDDVVERLKVNPDEPIADGFKNASVLFADISGFVGLARQLGPEKTVALLNRIVTEFDELAQRHGVEKIKTIGDAYMVASGVPVARPDHAMLLARMALDMLTVTRRIANAENQSIEIRIGMATGPMMAGVIGRHKFSYDVWGDPVNLASRLESLSEPGRILVCASSQAALRDMFEFEPRGLVDIKGVGAENLWYLTGLKTFASLSSAANTLT